MLDYDLVRALEEAWRRVGPRVMGDADELAARKARRRMGVMRRPARAWCLAVRACDRRMTGMRFAMVPDRPVWWDEGEHCYRRVEHTVRLEAKELAWLCRPVAIPRPGVTWKELAQMLGVDAVSVYKAMKRGTYSVRRVAGLGGVRGGKPIPVIYTKQLLDPAGIPLGAMADAEWGTMWKYVSERIPAGLSQTLVRRPVYRPWRGSLKFRGWRWVCPGCGELVNRVYCPVAGLVAPFAARFVEEEGDGSADGVEWPAACFACGACHEVQHAGRIDGDDWDKLVARVSGGLLYGKEVERPGWWVVKRKQKDGRKGRTVATPQRDAIEKLLVETEMTYREIAKRLGLAEGTVNGQAWRVYRRRGARSRGELREKIGTENAGGEMRRAG